jgi:hypothetical protein
MRRTLALLGLLLAVAMPASANPNLTIGAGGDTLVSADPATARARLGLLGAAGLAGVRVELSWSAGQTSPAPDQLAPLQATAAAADAIGDRVLMAVGFLDVPRDDASRQLFDAWLKQLVLAIPEVREVIIGDEPNRGTAWTPTDYEAVLASAYDTLKGVSGRYYVDGGALAGDAATAPTRFVAGLGTAYRASGRTKPLMDAFAFHPVAAASPSPSAAISVADYPKLVSALGRAFDGTPQTGSTVPVVYDEVGVESVVPPAKASLYAGSEPTAAVAEATQADLYRRAVALAFCQPTVDGLLLARTVDDADLAGSQAGLYYPDLSPKSDLGAVRSFALAARSGAIATCPGVAAAPGADVTFDTAVLAATVRCARDCWYVTDLERLPSTVPVAARPGLARGGAPSAISLAGSGLPAGSYRMTVQIVSRYNSGGKVVRSSGAFSID